jgi:hypothetical protein
MSAGKACAKSLMETCMLLRERLEEWLRKQSLHERFTVQAVSLINGAVEYLMSNQFLYNKTN